MSPAGEARLFLALDTSTSRGAVAVGSLGTVLGRVFLERQASFAADLIPAVRGALEMGGVHLGDLSGVVVGAGPGSFTGVRVGAATAKGLVHALGIPIWAFSSLAAGAATTDALSPEAVGEGGGDAAMPMAPGLAACPRCVLFDARGDRVYAACYRFGSGGPPVELLSPRATDLAGIVAAVHALDETVAFAGDGALKHQDRIRDAGFPVLGAPAGMPTGDGLLHLLALDAEAPPLEDPHRWEPEYLKASSAEKARKA